jgi:hypothetical protein
MVYGRKFPKNSQQDEVDRCRQSSMGLFCDHQVSTDTLPPKIDLGECIAISYLTNLDRICNERGHGIYDYNVCTSCQATPVVLYASNVTLMSALTNFSADMKNYARNRCARCCAASCACFYDVRGDKSDIRHSVSLLLERISQKWSMK